MYTLKACSTSGDAARQLQYSKLTLQELLKPFQEHEYTKVSPLSAGLLCLPIWLWQTMAVLCTQQLPSCETALRNKASCSGLHQGFPLSS